MNISDELYIAAAVPTCISCGARRLRHQAVRRRQQHCCAEICDFRAQLTIALHVQHDVV